MSKLDQYLENSVEDILQFGKLTRPVVVGENLTIKMCPLTEGELLDAKLATSSVARLDIVTYQAVESFEILIRSIKVINGSDVYEMAKQEIEESNEEIDPKKFALNAVRKIFSKFPPKLLNYLSDEYNELVESQYKDMKGTIGKNIENF